MKNYVYAAFLAASSIKYVTAYCDDPSPAFLPPDLEQRSQELDQLKTSITSSVEDILKTGQYNTSAFSLEITTPTHSIFDLHAGAKVVNEGTHHVRSDSAYRIASMTKPFTVLSILQQVVQGNLHLDDTVLKYIPELNEPQNGTLPWKDITLRALASQIAGIPRDMAQGDIIEDPEQAARFGLPPLNSKDEGIPQCDSVVNYTTACTKSDLLHWVKREKPLFAPNQESSYSNLNYLLLGLVLENVTGTTYEKYIQREIVDKLDMKYTSFDTPPESRMVIPADTNFYWNFTMGIADATGGLYSCSKDMSKFIRYVLTHHNGLHVPGLNWFQPTSWSATLQTFYGMPWEIFRTSTDKILGDSASTRPLTFVTKGGGLPGYTSMIIMNPEYNFGITVLVGGNPELMEKIRAVATKAMIHYADNLAQKQTAARYAGTFVADPKSRLNSSMTLEWSAQRGLTVLRFISNNTDVIQAIADASERKREDVLFQVVPTLLYMDEKHSAGERWRIIIKNARTEPKADGDPWDNDCITDLDSQAYAGQPLKEIVFWGKDKHDRVEKVRLSAYRIELDRDDGSDGVFGGNQQQKGQKHFDLL